MEEEYYCHSCSPHTSSLNATALNLTASTYQLTKFLKHTLPPSQRGLISTFNNTDYESYRNYTINTIFSGSTQIDQYGRTNLLWLAAPDHMLGVTYEDEVIKCDSDVIKVVFPFDGDRIHAYPVSAAELVMKSCKSCGTNILTGTTNNL